ncbi:Eco47II restriction endonuclease [uncultured archaeon]|nr:Eco47II restriction endonuclease [uncultured archaeon]
MNTRQTSEIIPANFKELVETLIRDCFHCVNCKPPEYDLMLNKYISEHADIINKANKLKIIQMKVGNCWQHIFGFAFDIRDLGVGHKTGLDLLSKKYKFCIELKNRYNTDNASARKTNYNKLKAYKEQHPEFDCIYGIINDKRPEGQDKKIDVNGTEIHYLSGDKLLSFVFKDKKEIVLGIVHECISN